MVADGIPINPEKHVFQQRPERSAERNLRDEASEALEKGNEVLPLSESAFGKPTAASAMRALQAFNNLGESLLNPNQSPLLSNLVNQCDNVFERALLKALRPTDDPTEKQKQQDLFAMIQKALEESAKHS